MKFFQSQVFSLSTLLVFAIASCNSEPQKDNFAYTTDQLMAAANELDSLYLVAFNNGDVEALMNLHWNSPELLSYPPDGMEIKGYDAVKNSYTKGFSANKGAKLEYTSTFNIPFADGVAGFGTYRWIMPVEGSAPIVVEGRYTDVKSYKDGKMVIVHDHSSVPLPPPPAEEAKVDTQ